MKFTLKEPGYERLKLKWDGMLSSFAFKFNLRRYIKAWLPLSPAILEMVSHCLPSPVQSAPHRSHRLMPQPTLKAALPPAAAAELTASRRAVAACETAAGTPTTAFVSKMLSVPASAVHGMQGVAPSAATSVFMVWWCRLTLRNPS
jgi:ribosome assembly protein 1